MTLGPITIGHTHRTIRNKTAGTVTTSSTHEMHRCMHHHQPRANAMPLEGEQIVS